MIGRLNGWISGNDALNPSYVCCGERDGFWGRTLSIHPTYVVGKKMDFGENALNPSYGRCRLVLNFLHATA
jgi:hypothetical protein